MTIKVRSFGLDDLVVAGMGARTFESKRRDRTSQPYTCPLPALVPSGALFYHSSSFVCLAPLTQKKVT